MQIFQTTRLKLKNRKGLFLLRFLIASILVLIIVILLIFERKEKRNSQIKHKKLNSDREFNLAKDSIKSLENQKKVSLFISENTDKKNQLENLNSNKIFENVIKRPEKSLSYNNKTANIIFENKENGKAKDFSKTITEIASEINNEDARKLDENVNKPNENLNKINYPNSSSSYSTEVSMNVSDSDIGLRLNKALKLLKSGDTITAMNQMRGIARENKKFIAVWHNLALEYLIQQDKNNTLRCLNKLEKLVNSKRIRNKLNEIIDLTKNNKTTEALNKLRELKPKEE